MRWIESIVEEEMERKQNNVLFVMKEVQESPFQVSLVGNFSGEKTRGGKERNKR